jgi:hypothetical protein
MEKTVKQRLVEFIAALNITQAEFQRRCNLSSGYINNMVNGIGAAKLDQILSEYPLLNAKWLLTGEGEMLKPQQPQVQQNNYNGNNNYVVGSGNSVQCSHPMVVDITDCCEVECPKCGEHIEVSAGAVMRVVPTEITKLPDINIEYWRKKNEDDMPLVNFIRAWGPDTFAVKVDTRAMEPDYREGTYLVLRKLPDLSYARADGSPYVVDTMRPHTLFRNLTDKYDGTYLLTANSDKRSSIRLKAQDITNVYDIVGSFRLGR